MRRKKNNSIYKTLILIGVAILGSVFTVANKNSSDNKEESQTVEKKIVTHKTPKSGKATETTPKKSNTTTNQQSEANLEIPKMNTAVAEQILKRTAYTVSYNADLRIPNWVAWQLTSEHTSGKNKRDGISFAEDMEVPEPRATNMDYMQSGYDRGHMCPSGDNKWSQTAQLESFLYTNCCPQRHSLNAGIWNDLEAACRKWAKVYGTVYIACGPLLKGDRHKRIGKNKVVVPEAFFKVILRMGDSPAAIGFIYNNEGKNEPLDCSYRTVDEIEELTGIDFFPSLNNAIEKKIEATADYSDWENK